MHSSFIEQQIQSTAHKLAIYLLPLVVFAGYFHPYIFIAGITLFFLMTSFRLLKSMLFWLLVVGGISAVIPVLAPIIFIVMIVLFLMRIGFVIKNWKPFVSGILFYGFIGFLIYRSFLYYEYSGPYIVFNLYESLGVSSLNWLFPGFIEGFIMSLAGFLLLQMILKMLYNCGYESYQALGIMGSAPLIIISFLLPFLKMHIGGDFFMTETNPVHGEVTTHSATGEPIETKMIAAQERAPVYVKDYVRTAPDGDPTNNLSYNGPDKKVPTGELVEVRGHVRTAPDGDPTNNLSYNGFDEKVPNSEFVDGSGLVQTMHDEDPSNEYFNDYSSDSQSEMNKTSKPENQDIILYTAGGNFKDGKGEDSLRETRYKDKQKQNTRMIALSVIGLLGIGVGVFFIVDTTKTPDSAVDHSIEAEREDRLNEYNEVNDTSSTEYGYRLEDNMDEELSNTGDIQGVDEAASLPQKLYRIQAGAYSSEENALELVSDIKAHGFEAIIKKSGELHIVQVGSFSVKKNAENQLAELQSLGIDGFIKYE